MKGKLPEEFEEVATARQSAAPEEAAPERRRRLKKEFDKHDSRPDAKAPPAFVLPGGQNASGNAEPGNSIAVTRYWFYSDSYYQQYMSRPAARQQMNKALDKVIAQGLNNRWPDLFVTGHQKNGVVDDVLCRAVQNRLAELKRASPESQKILTLPPFNTRSAEEALSILRTMEVRIGQPVKTQPEAKAKAAPA